MKCLIDTICTTNLLFTTAFDTHEEMACGPWFPFYGILRMSISQQSVKTE